MSLSEESRRSLYEAYATTHSGRSSEGMSSVAFIREILRFLPRDRDAEIVDLGCGQGRLVQQLNRIGYRRAWGIDVSPEQVHLAHSDGIEQVKLGNFFEDTLARGSLSAAIAVDFFEHLDKQEVLVALQRIYDALEPSGVLILRVPNAVSPFVGNYFYGDFTHETAFTSRSLRQLGAASGYRLVGIYATPPRVHSLKSLFRSALWAVIGSALKLALASETGVLRGHIVTQNVVAVMTK